MDTRNKRSSAIGVSLPWRGMLPAPDGAIDQADRQHITLFYAGILAEEEEEVVVLFGGSFHEPRRNLAWVESVRRLAWVEERRDVTWTDQ